MSRKGKETGKITEADIPWDPSEEEGPQSVLRAAQRKRRVFFDQLSGGDRSARITPAILTKKELALSFQLSPEDQEGLRLRGASLIISPQKHDTWKIAASTGSRGNSTKVGTYLGIGGDVKWADWGGRPKGQTITPEDRANLARVAHELWQELSDATRNELSDRGRGFIELFSAPER